MSGSAYRQHTRGRSRRREWPHARDVPRQASLLPRLGDVLGEFRRRPPFPRMAAKRHARRQRRVVHRVSSSPPPVLFFFFCGSQTLNERTAERRKRSIRRSGTRSSRMVITSVATGSSSVLWRAVIRKDATSGGVPKSSGALNSSSLVIRVRGYALPFFSGRGLTFGGAGRLGVNHGIAQDGRVAVLTVFRV